MLTPNALPASFGAEHKEGGWRVNLEALERVSGWNPTAGGGFLVMVQGWHFTSAKAPYPCFCEKRAVCSALACPHLEKESKQTSLTLDRSQWKFVFLAFEKWKQRRTLGDGEAEQWFVLEHLH